jgi:hypothetical protein
VIRRGGEEARRRVGKEAGRRRRPATTTTTARDDGVFCFEHGATTHAHRERASKSARARIYAQNSSVKKKDERTEPRASPPQNQIEPHVREGGTAPWPLHSGAGPPRHRSTQFFLSPPKTRSPEPQHNHHENHHQAPTRRSKRRGGRRRLLLDLPRGPLAAGRLPAIVLRLPALAQGAPPVPAHVQHLQGRHRVALLLLGGACDSSSSFLRASRRERGRRPLHPFAHPPQKNRKSLPAPAPKLPTLHVPDTPDPLRARAAFGGVWVGRARPRFRRRGVGGAPPSAATSAGGADLGGSTIWRRMDGRTKNSRSRPQP